MFVIDPAVPGTIVAAHFVDPNERGDAAELETPRPGMRRGDDIAAAPDGSVWVTDSLGEGITRFTPGGVFSTAGSTPDGTFDGIIAAAPTGRCGARSRATP